MNLGRRKESTIHGITGLVKSTKHKKYVLTTLITYKIDFKLRNIAIGKRGPFYNDKRASS